MTKISFEKALKQLEQIVQELESADLPLEKAISRFEEGIRLKRLCSQKLEETEKKVTILLEDEKGNIEEAPFDTEQK